MSQSTNIQNLAKALCMAQVELPSVKFDAKNPFLKNDYASLGALVEAARPIISKYGLSVTQFPASNNAMVGVQTILMHESGEFIENTIFVLPESAKGLSINQSVGVTITYLRRYAYAAVLGLIADKDTDGDANPQATEENAVANDKVSKLLNRNWSNEQTEAVSVTVLDAINEPLTKEEATTILDLSVLPENVSPKAIQSWMRHYLKSDGVEPLLKAADANDAYNKAKKSK